MDVYPKELKAARILPIPKTNNAQECNEVRPISILPVCAKIFEKVIVDRSIAFFETNDFLTSKQHGYRKNKSTTTAIMEIIQYINNAYNEHQKVQLNMLDLSKAFDSVNHAKLLGKLEWYGVRGCPLKLVESYLEERSQVVDWRGEVAEPSVVARGIAQGSVLGPFLFIVYTNDLVGVLPSAEVCLYADDTSILVTEKDEEALYYNTKITSNVLMRTG